MRIDCSNPGSPKTCSQAQGLAVSLQQPPDCLAGGDSIAGPVQFSGLRGHDIGCTAFLRDDEWQS